MPRETHVENETRQPERVLLGHCPVCGRVVVVENHHEVWPLVNCRCGWDGATDEIADYVRYENHGIIREAQ